MFVVVGVDGKGTGNGKGNGKAYCVLPWWWGIGVVGLQQLRALLLQTVAWMLPGGKGMCR